MKTKQEIFNILDKYVKEKSNKEHCLMVGYSLQGLAKYLKKNNEEQEKWFVVGVLHDIDIEEYGGDIKNHCLVGEEILKKENVCQEIIDIIKTHNEVLGFERKTDLEHALFSIDGLTGIIRAYVLMRPDKDIKQAKISSIKKKLKDKTFAQAIKRDEIYLIEDKLNLSVDVVIDVVLKELKENISLI